MIVSYAVHLAPALLDNVLHRPQLNGISAAYWAALCCRKFATNCLMACRYVSAVNRAGSLRGSPGQDASQSRRADST